LLLLKHGRGIDDLALRLLQLEILRLNLSVGKCLLFSDQFLLNLNLLQSFLFLLQLNLHLESFLLSPLLLFGSVFNFGIQLILQDSGLITQLLEVRLKFFILSLLFFANLSMVELCFLKLLLLRKENIRHGNGLLLEVTELTLEALELIQDITVLLLLCFHH
jgi:hypothetical protein